MLANHWMAVPTGGAVNVGGDTEGDMAGGTVTC